MMIKEAKGQWKDSDSGVPWQIKLKSEKECELMIVGFSPGAAGSKYDGQIGSLILESSCGMLKTKSSGMDDSVRKMAPASLIGKVVTVCFNEISKNKNKETVALDHPRIVDMRPDKTEADSLEHIKTIKSVRK